jgi:hypothetical protein
MFYPFFHKNSNFFVGNYMVEFMPIQATESKLKLLPVKYWCKLFFSKTY